MKCAYCRGTGNTEDFGVCPWCQGKGELDLAQSLEWRDRQRPPEAADRNREAVRCLGDAVIAEALIRASDGDVIHIQHGMQFCHEKTVWAIMCDGVPVSCYESREMAESMLKAVRVFAPDGEVRQIGYRLLDENSAPAPVDVLAERP